MPTNLGKSAHTSENGVKEVLPVINYFFMKYCVIYKY